MKANSHHNEAAGALLLPLAGQPPQQCLRVARIEATDADTHSLMAMGICNGRSIDILRTGDPMIVRVCGTRIGISARLAGRILVSTCPDTDCPEQRCG